MWDDRLEDYLNDENNLEEADPEIKHQYFRYKYIIGLYAAKLSYSPSENMKEDFLRRIRRRNTFKKALKYAIVAGSVTAVILFLKMGLGSGFGTETVPSDTFNEVVNSVQIIRTLGDGF